MKKHRMLSITSHSVLRHLATLLVLAMLLGTLAVPGNAQLADTVSVGLYFVKNALFAANLQNVTGYGSGYELGYYDADANGGLTRFVPLGYTDRVQITMLPDMTMYLSGDKFYTDNPGSYNAVVGAYHLELAYDYQDYAAARQAADNYYGGFVAYSYGSYYVRFGSYANYQDAAAESEYHSDCTVTGGSDYGITIVDTNTGEILFELDQGYGTALGVVPDGDIESRTWFKGNQYNGGFRYDRPEAGAMHAANIVSLEQYVAAVLSREFVVSWPDEVLKAASCCIRTFVNANHKHTTFDVCNSTCCQVYKGVYQGKQWEHLEALCRETAGECIYYGNTPILAVYHSSNGGATVASKDAWTIDYPYLQAVYDPFESTVKTGARDWSTTFTLGELTSIANNWGFDCSAISDVYVSEYTDLGNVAGVTFVATNGTKHTFRGENTVLLGGNFSSRRYVIIPPWGSATVTDVSMGDDVVLGGGSSGSASTNDGNFAVFDGTSTITQSSIAVITANGTVTVEGSAEILTDGGGNHGTVSDRPAASTAYPAPQFETRTIDNPTGEYMVYGSGWGHNVGLSAYGAYAMAQQGYTYTEILQYYYQGVEIR